jgi:hypothetical protein
LPNPKKITTFAPQRSKYFEFLHKNSSKETLMQSFFNNYNLKKVQGTKAEVSYNRITREPEPQFFFQRWTIFER